MTNSAQANLPDAVCADCGHVSWPEGVQRVAAYLKSHAHCQIPRMLDGAARTAQQAADALGIGVGQIAKSIIFRLHEVAGEAGAPSPDRAVLVITSGDRRVDEAKVQALVCVAGGRLGRADAAFVKAQTGFSIGGVAPVAHTHEPVTLIDRELFRFAEIWAAAGHPHAVFQLTPQDLLRLARAQALDVTVQVVDKLAMQSFQQRAQTALATRHDVASPCVSICRMDDRSGRCQGCWRTLDEIAQWAQLSDADKRSVWLELMQRARQGNP